MNAIFRTNFSLFLLAALFGAGCSDDVPLAVEPTQPTPAPGTLSEVTIGCQSGIGAEVRTSLGDRKEETVEVRWTKDDTFHLSVREAESGPWVTENADFHLQSFSSEWSGATFVGSVDLSKYKTTKSYDYFASAPAGTSTLAADGTATFTLPALQNGEFSGAYDWMTASQKGAHALEGNPHTNDPKKPYPQLTFTHRIHVLEITLADILLTDKSGVTEPIEAIELTFPTAVAGQLSIAADADASTLPTIPEGGGRTIRLEFATPKTAGDKVYAFIAPVQLSADAAVAIKAFGTQGHESVELTFSKSDAAAPGLFRSGRVSPISYRVPQRRIVTKVEFSLGDALGKNTLGEEVTKFRIVVVDGSGNPTGDPIHTFDVNAENKYVVEYEGVFSNNPYSGKQYKVQYCSPSTKDWALITKAPFTIDVEAEEYNRIAALPVPYLFEEDFSKMTETNEWDSNYTGGSIAGSKAGHQFNTNLSGTWSGARCGVSAGKAIRLAARRECANLGFTTIENIYPARVDSAPLSPIKEGKKVSVSVSYKYSSNQDKGGISSKNRAKICHFGYTDTAADQVFKSDAEDGTFDSSNQYTIEANENDGSYTQIGHSRTHTLSGCSNVSRLTWRLEVESAKGSNNNTCWLYLDNIKVSIKQ